MNVITYPKRKYVRLRHYDYSQNGLYFITICIHNKKCLLGNIIDNVMNENDIGKMVRHYYYRIEEKFDDLYCLDFVIMPNHIHFILQIDRETESDSNNNIISVIQWFKIVTTNNYIKNVKQGLWEPFDKKLWQTSFYEHIIRDEKSYIGIAEYIENNPYNWHKDSLFIS